MGGALRRVGRPRVGTSQPKSKQHGQTDRTASVASFELDQQQDCTPEVKHPVSVDEQLDRTPKVKHPVFVGKHDYDSRTDDQLSFRKGDLMYVISMDNEGWWFARSKDTGREGYIPSNYVAEWESLDAEEWFWRGMKKVDAERQLMMGSNQYGSFVVREKTPGNYTLSIRDKEKVRHYRIKCHENGTFSVTPSVTFATIQTLVAYYKSQPHGLCVNLKHPCLLSVKPPTAGLSVQTNSEWEIDRRQIGLIKKLGVGQFGEVWKGVWNKTTQVAVKTLKPGTISAATFLREATQMKRLHHPNVIQLYAVCTREEPIYIVTELMTLGSLQNYLRGEGRSLKLPQLISMCSQIAGGMAHLESQNYVHHDLAAKNILVTDDLICKVDLSLARVTDEDAHKANTDVKFPVKWAAPEAAMYSEFTIKSDVWSFGMVLYEVIASDRFPYPGMTDAEVMRALQHGYSMTRVMKCPEKLHDIMLDCWKEDPDDRPNFETLQWKLEEFYS